MYDCPGLHLEHTPLVSGGHMYIISIYCYAPFFTLKSWVDVVDEGGIPGVQGMPDAPACLPAGLLTEHDSLLALSTWPPSPSWKVLFSFILFIILYSFLISRPTWQNFTWHIGLFLNSYNVFIGVCLKPADEIIYFLFLESSFHFRSPFTGKWQHCRVKTSL